MNNRNTVFTTLSAIGMVLVILGHLNSNLLTIGGLFPYYSYHVMIFVFISGYFYKPENENRLLHYVAHKIKTLLLPYFMWNVIYGVIAVTLHKFGFCIGGEISLFNLFVAPFVGGHQFMYNAPAWFVPALFLLEICNAFGRRVLGIIKIKSEYIIFLLYILMGVFVVYMAKRGSVYAYYKIPGRIMLMAPCLQMGRLYKEKGEKYDIMPSIIYFPLLLLMNYIITKTHAGLAYGVVWVTSFANTVFTPFITAATGILLWLRVSKLCALWLDRHGDNILSRIVNYTGEHTYSLMLHHLIVFMGIKEVIYILYKFGVAFAKNFDAELYHSDIYYNYLPFGNEYFNILYLIVIMGTILLLQKTLDRAMRRKL